MDLRQNKYLLLERFAEFLNRVEDYRRYPPPKWEKSYSGWSIDKSRKRKEAWRHLKVWKLRRRRKGLAEIAREARISRDNAKKSFSRAFELIEGYPFDPTKYRKDYKEIKKGELRRTCATCHDKDTCTVACPDVELYANQDEVALQEKL